MPEMTPKQIAVAKPGDVKPGDRVIVVRPDPEYGIGCIAAGYDAAYLVDRVDPGGTRLHITTRLPFITDPIPIDVHEVIKTDRAPWWEERKP